MNLEQFLDTYVDVAFGRNEKFRTSIQKGLMELLGSSDYTPVLLSLYIDEKMRTTLKETDKDAETIIEKCVNAFKYLKEKDSFEKSYVRNLGKRLLGKKTNVEFERSIVQKFKVGAITRCAL
jgi:cullin 3